MMAIITSDCENEDQTKKEKRRMKRMERMETHEERRRRKRRRLKRMELKEEKEGSEGEEGRRRKLINLSLFLGFLLLLGHTDEGNCLLRQHPVISNEQQGPAFLQEPPGKVHFSNSTGAIVSCTARGSPMPTVAWELADGSEVIDVPGLRHLRPDGSLVFPPFAAHQYSQDIHATIYRCVAKNPVGEVQSRDIQVRAVVHQVYKLQVHDEFVIRGNAAVLRCHVPTFVKEFVLVVAWLKDDKVVVTSSSPRGIGRHSLLSSGELYIRNSSRHDSGSYRCQTRDQLTGEIITSAVTGRLRVTEPHGGVAPRITFSSNSLVRAIEGDSLELACAAQAFPLPTFRWFKEEDSGVVSSILIRESIVQQREGSLLINHVRVSNSGKYVCEVNNSVGEERVRINLVVTSPLVVRMEPHRMEVDVGKPVAFNCSISGSPVTSVMWLKDRRPLMMDALEGLTGEGGRFRLLQPTILSIRAVSREDSGMYQCIVSNDWESAQAGAELKLGDIAPIILSTFEEGTVEPGVFVSFRCVASGAPLPMIVWTLDGDKIPGFARFRVGDYVTTSGQVVSFVNITSAKVVDGGEYSCLAANDVGQAAYVGRLNVVGPPAARQTTSNNITVVAGRSVIIRCPVIGFPLNSMQWQHNGHTLPINHRQKVDQLSPKGFGGNLRLENAQRPGDEGEYSCFATGSTGGQAVRGTVSLTIKVSPLIDTQPLPERLFTNEGMKIKLVCSVIQGDSPVDIKWYKNGLALASSRSVAVQNSEDYSLLTFKRVTYDDRGNYTCEAANEVEASNRTSSLVVNVPPKWRIEPNNVFVSLGKKIAIDCSAEGFPAARIAWRKSMATSSSLEATRLTAAAVTGIPSEFRDILSSYRHQVYANGTLVIQEADKADSGHYMCQVSNGIGAGLSKVVFLTVHIPPYFDTKFVSMSSKKEDTSILRCDANGDLPMVITWQKDKQSLDSLIDKRYVIKEESSSRATVSSQLQILSTGRQDSALYTCEATNKFGSDDTNIQLVVQEPPEAPTIVEIKEKTSRSALVHWKAPYSGNSAISGFILQYRNESSDDSREWTHVKNNNVELKATLHGLFPVTKYQVRVVAENSIGMSDASQPISLETSEEVPGGPPLDVMVEASGAQSLKVKWRGPRRELRYGKIRGYYIGYRVAQAEESYNYKNVEATFTEDEPTNAELHMSYITNLRRKTTYEIIVQGYNNAGTGPRSDEVRTTTLEAAPPTSPLLEVLSTTSSSINLRWDSNQNEVEEREFILYYRPENSPKWLKKELRTRSSQYGLEGLSCGTRYQLYMTATNSLGTGEPSDTVVGRTKGAAAISPQNNDFLSVNSSAATLNLRKWLNGGCPIKSFTIKYRPSMSGSSSVPFSHQRHWTWLNKELPYGQEKVVISPLVPGRSYSLVVAALSEAGPTEAEYEFRTLNQTLSTVSPLSPPKQVSQTTTMPFFRHFAVLLPVFISVGVLIIVLAVLMVCIKRQNESISGAGVDRVSTTSLHKSDLHPTDSLALSDYQRGMGMGCPSENLTKGKQLETSPDTYGKMTASYYSSPTRKLSATTPLTIRQVQSVRSNHDYAEPYAQVPPPRCLLDDDHHLSNCSALIQMGPNSRVTLPPEGPYATIKRSPPRPSSFILTSPAGYPGS